MERELVIGGFYRHFKNKLYQVKAVAYHSETREKMVVYQALYGDYATYVRPYDMFMSEVDHEKYPDIFQKYRFEQVQIEHKEGVQSQSVQSKDMAQDMKHQAAASVQNIPKQENTSESHTMNPINTEKQQPVSVADEQVDDRLMQFLDAESYQEKLNVLTGLRAKLDDKLIDAMAVAMDIEVEEGPLDKRYASLRSCIQTHLKFEGDRTRFNR